MQITIEKAEFLLFALQLTKIKINMNNVSQEND